MIYEMRTYNCVPGGAQELIKLLNHAYKIRAKYSEVAGFWYTDIGPLHQVVHIWPYESPNDRLRIRQAAAADPEWPPAGTDQLILDMQSEIFLPVSFSPPLTPGRFGPVYEMRSYTIRNRSLPEIEKRLAPALPERVKLSPLLLAMVSENGPLNRFVHIWPYKSMQHRDDVRAQAEAAGIWPPKGVREFSLRQENKILRPAPFSPLQ
ncbi:MAG: NIPSNAP family protein [Alphaproteobacteria bacterium]|nr:NIPSNAP family protein [Alphaproteobacteria bacterium]